MKARVWLLFRCVTKPTTTTLIQRLEQQRLDNRLPTDIQPRRTFVEFTKQSLRQIHVDPPHGRTTVNWLVKNPEASAPRVAIPAISSTDGEGLDLFGIDILFLFRRFPSSDQAMELPFSVASRVASSCFV